MGVSTEISRRNLLKGAVLSAAGVAALGVMGCSPQAPDASGDAGAGATDGQGAHTWEIKPEPIAADQIKETVDTEVLVIGGGYSGTCCALSAAENGAKVILVEKDAMLNGHGVGGTGAIGSRELDKLGISYDVTPGVSSFSGAAAALNAEYTLPEVSQSVIITRMAGRTPVPEGEQLRKLASHGCTMVLFLSTGLLEQVEEELTAGGYSPDTPAAIVYKATWPEEKVFRCTVSTLAKTARENRITKTALITIGHFLGDDYERSKLYDPAFTHEFREASR